MSIFSRRPLRRLLRQTWGPATAGAWTPASLGASLALWLDADSLANVWQNSGGTGAVTTSGDPVGQASDRSGLGRHFIQGASNRRFTWQQNALGTGHSAIRADDIDDILAPAATFALTGAQTWALTYRLTSVPVGEFDDILDLGDGATTTSRLIATDNGAYPRITWCFDFAGGAAGVGISPTLDTVKHSLLIVYSGGGASTPGNYTCWLDGVSQSVAAGAALGPYLGTATLGNKSDFTGPAAVDLGKVVLASSALSGGNLSNLQAYLAASIA